MNASLQMLEAIAGQEVQQTRHAMVLETNAHIQQQRSQIVEEARQFLTSQMLIAQKNFEEHHEVATRSYKAYEEDNQRKQTELSNMWLELYQEGHCMRALCQNKDTLEYELRAAQNQEQLQSAKIHVGQLESLKAQSEVKNFEHQMQEVLKQKDEEINTR